MNGFEILPSSSGGSDPLKLDLAGGTMTGALAVTPGTLATTGLRLAQTWNSADVTCRALEVAVTDTACASDSTIARFVGGAAGTTPQVQIGKDGRVQTAVGGAFPQFCGVGHTTTGMRVASDRVDFWLGGSVIATMQSGVCTLNGLSLQFGSGTSEVSHSSNILSQSNGANAQTYRIFGNTTGSHYLNMTHNGTDAVLSVNGGGALHISSLPTSNPGPGILWNNAGTPAIGT